jgi:hypothetical protein
MCRWGLEILFAGRVLGERDVTSITFNVGAKPASALTPVQS